MSVSSSYKQDACPTIRCYIRIKPKKINYDQNHDQAPLIPILLIGTWFFLLELYGYYKRDVNRNDIRLWLRSTPFNNIDSLILCNRSHYCCEKSLDVHWKDVSLTQFSFNNFNRFFASFEILCIWHYLLYNYAQAQGPS